MSIDARCIKCGEILSSFLTESGDILCVEPCENGCCGTEEDKFETDKDFEE